MMVSRYDSNVFEKNIEKQISDIEARLHNHSGSVKDLIKDLNSAKINNFKESVDEINREIEQRRELSKALVNSYDRIVLMLNKATEQLTIENIRERIDITERIAQIEDAKLKEKKDCWRDIASLKRELRERLLEVRDEQNKQDSLSDIMG